MASVRGNILKFVLRNAGNLNPEKQPNAIAKIRKFSKIMLNDKKPKGFSLSKEQTQNGTKYERVYKNDAKKNGKVIYYLHGGAYIAGLIWIYRTFATDFYETVGAELILLDYSLAPENKYPTQLNEALDVWDELVNKQGYDPKDIIIGGDSAGGNLTLSLLLKLRDEKKTLPNSAFCLSPWTDMTASGKSYVENYSNDVMFGEKNREITELSKEKFLNSELYCFVGDADRNDPYVSPVFGDYYGFPPMYFSAGEHEMLLSDTLSIVDNLKKNNVPVEVEIKDEMFHTYVIYGAFMPEGAESFKKILEFIKKQFNNEN